MIIEMNNKTILDVYIDECKEALNLKSDSELSLYLGYSRGTVNAWRMGKSCPDDYSAFSIAEIINADPRSLIARIREEYENDTLKKQFWQEKIKEYGYINPLILGSINIGGILVYILC